MSNQILLLSRVDYINSQMQMKDRANLDTSFLGTPFDRQVRIQDWDQQQVTNQAVLILGVGGLGSGVMMNLLRLGVGRLFLVDYDVVDIHNLNRQLMFTPADVGKPKVQAALRNSTFHNVGNTQIEIFHGNALTNWKIIVGFAKRSTFVYNCIDWGDKFDSAVCSLCLALKIPLVMGGTFATSLTVDFFPSNGQPCYLCTDDANAKWQNIESISPSKILQIQDLSFLPKNNNPVGRSSVIVCTICSQFMVSHQINWLFLSQQKPYKASRLIFYHNIFEIIKFDLEINPKCPFCAKPKQQEIGQSIEPVKETLKIEQKQIQSKQDLNLTPEIKLQKIQEILTQQVQSVGQSVVNSIQNVGGSS